MEHREAVEYDLLVSTGYQLKDVGRSLSWGALESVLRQGGTETALMRELHPEIHAWSTRTKTNEILANIFDLLAQINANLVKIGGGRASRPKPYPRPVTKKEPDDARHFGSGALPVNELRAWMEEKRREYARSRTGDHNRNPGP